MAFTTAPLHLSTVLGTLCTVGGGIYYVLSVLFRLFGYYWNTVGLLAATVFFVGGLILLCMGVMGMYLSRVYLQVKDRPIYLAKEILVKEKGKK